MFPKDPFLSYPEEVMFHNDNVRIATTVIECADCVGEAGCSIHAYLEGLKQAIITAQQPGEDTVKGLDELANINQLAVISKSLHVSGGGGPVMVYQCSQGDGLLKLDVHYAGELA